MRRSPHDPKRKESISALADFGILLNQKGEKKLHCIFRMIQLSFGEIEFSARANLDLSSTHENTRMKRLPGDFPNGVIQIDQVVFHPLLFGN